ncbi:MAG: peptidylprolyl isomerase [Tidjanibacter sp.]|nr:peptidylprolyl isomerase [Tidjanibacter sp.]
MFKHFVKLFVVCASVLAVSSVSAQERFVVDKIVAVVGSSGISYSEVVEAANNLVEQRRQQGYTTDRDPINEALESLMLQKLLYNQAQIDSVMINTEVIAEAVEEQVQSMINQAGSIAALEAQENMAIYDIRRNLRTEVEEQQYAQSMQYEVTSKVTITPGEVERFFQTISRDSLPIIPEQYIYAQITKFPEGAEEAKQRAKERLLEIRERIINGERFDMMARLYSADTGSSMQGGDMGFQELNRFVPAFADALGKLEVGQISGVVESEYGFHLIQLMDKQGNQYHSRHILIKPTYTPDDLAKSDKLLDSVAMLIRTDSMTFEDAAREFSDDKYSRENGGIVTNHELMAYYGANDTSFSTTRFNREDLGNDYTALRYLSMGEVSDSFQTQDLKGNPLSKIVKIVRIIPAHEADLAEDYLDLENLALQRKQNTEFEKWLNKKIESTYIRIDPDFREGEWSNKNWVK